jgi:hypothetical protein
MIGSALLALALSGAPLGGATTLDALEPQAGLFLQAGARKYLSGDPSDFGFLGRTPPSLGFDRAAILIKMLELDEELISAVYEKPGSLKIEHYLPGTRIPIRSDEDLFALADQSLPLLNLAWHIPREIRRYMVEHGYTGPIIDILSADDFVPAAA